MGYEVVVKVAAGAAVGSIMLLSSLDILRGRLLGLLELRLRLKLRLMLLVLSIGVVVTT